VISPFPHHLEKLQYESIVKLYKSKKFGPKGLVISNPKALICYHSAKKTIIAFSLVYSYAAVNLGQRDDSLFFF
jgi:hypothetical protein